MLNPNRKKRKPNKKKAQSTSSVDSKLEDLNASSYPYSKSEKSTEHLIQHLHNKHHITSKNYRQYLNDDEQPVAVAVINQDLELIDIDLPFLLSKQQ
ncbi:16464_t:CDS:2 [Cetraspora pellucida]|uniref:16464_t:CDS:1 n=1 Tax=Cetraspora pellucida TaxID=1433469 RepID=A0ACA9K477_9GLOM|nr:16464_t:CDS:2 [Cetraspora pellucida]